MDRKITLSFEESTIDKAKKYADKHNISLSRLIEFLLQKITSSNYQSMEDFPVSDWVHQVAEGEAVYHTSRKKTRKSSKTEYFASKK